MFVCLLPASAAAAERKAAPEPLAALLRSWGVKADLPFDYAIAFRDADPDATPRLEDVEAKARGGRIIHAERLSDADASQGEGHIKDRLVQLQSLYDPNPDPYFAILTKKTVCQDKYRMAYRPRKKNGTVLHFLELYANARRTYGACTGEMAFYRAAVAMIYCPRTRSAVILESFVPSAEYTPADARAVESLQCF
ncbi:MAG: hypothetical protein PHS14_04755 [Elusimicrobia bacterium]|nr:hypothetical protein [Elusimicrobiota bacterium]